MRTLIGILFLTLTTPAFAASGIFCKENGRVMTAYQKDEPAECAAALMEGSACFAGKRAEVIAMINNDLFNWDEEWLADAHFKGRDEIAYTWVDGPNELKEKLSLVRCPKGFFGR